MLPNTDNDRRHWNQGAQGTHLGTTHGNGFSEGISRRYTVKNVHRLSLSCLHAPKMKSVVPIDSHNGFTSLTINEEAWQEGELIGDNQVKTGCVENVSLRSSDKPKFMKQHLTSNNNLAQAEPENDWSKLANRNARSSHAPNRRCSAARQQWQQ